MLLKRIELYGFKSFARQTTLTFTVPVTAIVGPNGSGKSNIAEAVRFVLGEQSIKSLRGKRGEDLIFNGTHSASRQSKASVTIVFDNSKRNLNIDYDEVRITRVVHRDSTSEYLLNGSRVRLKDILEMLSVFHIGASSHHIISQGEADRILLASPKDRRNMIEDALGLKIYHYKKTESERKLQKTNENLSQVKALKKEIEPHLRFLEKQAEKIKQAEQLRRGLKELYVAYFVREKQYLDAEKKELEAEQKGPSEELEQVQKSIEAIKTKEEMSSEEKQTGAMLLSVEQSLEQTRHKREDLSRALGKIEGVIEYEERKLAEEEKKSAVSEEITIHKDALIHLRDSFIAFTDRVLREEDIPTVHAMVEEMRDKIESFCDTLIEKNIGGAVIVAFKNSLSKKRMEQKNIEQEVILLETEEKTLNDRRIELKQLLAQVVGKERENERELFVLQNKKTELSAKLEMLHMKESQHHVLRVDFESFLKEATAIVGHISYSERVSEDLSEKREEQEKRKNAILRTKIKLEEIGVGGGEILKEYKEVKERDEFLEKEITDLEKSAKSLESLITELNEKIEEQFKSGIQKINAQFQELFTLMFGGGKASLKILAPARRKAAKLNLELDADNSTGIDDETAEEDAQEGVDIAISLPRKKIKGLMMLSGGERALTSIALIFAMTQVNPPPFLILDETDAALDEMNSRKYGEMLERLAKETELVLITHNRETMTHAGVLYGVTSVDGVSHLLSVKFDEAKELAGKE